MSPPIGSVASRTVLATAGVAAQGLLRFAYTLTIGRLAGPEALADTSALLSLSVYMSLVLPAGLGIAASRYLPDPKLAPHAARQLSRWFWASSLILGLGAAPIAFWIVSDLVSALSCSLLVFAYNAYVYTRGVMMGEDRILRATIADFVSSLIAITALALVLFCDANWALLLPLSVSYLIFALITRPSTPAAKESDPDTIRTFRSFVRDATLGSLATGGLLPATMIFVRAYDSPEQAGLFAAALSLATPTNLLAQSINQVLIPHFARISNDSILLISSHRKILLATATIFAVIFTVLIIQAPWIITILFGSQYEEGAAAMQALLAVVFLVSATAAPAALLVASGRQRTFATIWAAGFGIGTAVMILTSPHLHMWGALLGFAIGGGGGSIAVIISGLAIRKVPIRPAY